MNDTSSLLCCCFEVIYLLPLFYYLSIDFAWDSGYLIKVFKYKIRIVNIFWIKKWSKIGGLKSCALEVFFFLSFFVKFLFLLKSSIQNYLILGLYWYSKGLQNLISKIRSLLTSLFYFRRESSSSQLHPNNAGFRRNIMIHSVATSFLGSSGRWPKSYDKNKTNNVSILMCLLPFLARFFSWLKYHNNVICAYEINYWLIRFFNVKEKIDA